MDRREGHCKTKDNTCESPEVWKHLTRCIVGVHVVLVEHSLSPVGCTMYSNQCFTFSLIQEFLQTGLLHSNCNFRFMNSNEFLIHAIKTRSVFLHL